eukprot:scaffold4582_cov202-Prasinococcus_capsulatus_cf.AAC.2
MEGERCCGVDGCGPRRAGKSSAGARDEGAGWVSVGLVGFVVLVTSARSPVGAAVARRRAHPSLVVAGVVVVGVSVVTRRRPRPQHAQGRECWRSYLVGVVVAARGPQRFRVVVVGGGRGTAARLCALPDALAQRAAPPPELSLPLQDAGEAMRQRGGGGIFGLDDQSPPPERTQGEGPPAPGAEPRAEGVTEPAATATGSTPTTGPPPTPIGQEELGPYETLRLRIEEIEQRLRRAGI